MNMMNFRPARMIPVQSGHGAPHMQLMRMGSMGVRPHFAMGGLGGLDAAVALARRGPPRPVQARAQNGDPIHTGPLRSPVAGRTDHLSVTVPEGSYIIPADVVNHFGEDNTEAGHRVMEALFKGSLIKQMRQQPGGAGLNKSHVPIAAAGGEFVVPPETVAHIGGGNLKKGHEILDKFVLMARAEHIKTLKKMPGPQKS